jgi:glycerol-3-phosphate transporter
MNQNIYRKKDSSLILSSLFAFLKIPKIPENCTSTQRADLLYPYWRLRILYSSFIGYAVFYFCRVNISMAIPNLQDSLGFSKTQIGLIVSALQITYGVGKFLNGIFADRSNPRYFMALGLFLSGLVNILFGLGSSLIVLMILWGINGWFQSMGFPPGAKLLSHWFSPSEYGRIWGIYGCSHQVGTAIILIFSGYIVVLGWQYVFWIPGIIAIVVAVFLFNRLRDVPSTMDLPPVEKYRGDIHNKETLDSLERQPTVSEALINHVLKNRYIWFIALGNFFLYIARYGALTWGPAFINEKKGIPISKAGWMMAFFEVAGILGMLSAGWISDRIFKARRGPIMAIYMFCLAFAMIAFWQIPDRYPSLFTLSLGLSGFFVYGPLMLVSVAMAGFAGKKVAATSAGFAGVWGYMGAVLSGVLVGWTIDHYGWTGGFLFFIGSALLSTLFFSFTWKIKPRGF